MGLTGDHRGAAKMKQKKRIMLINRRAPWGTIYAQESLEVALIGAAFEQEISIAFIGDGVFQLKRQQDGRAQGRPHFPAAFRALGDYEIRTLLVESESLSERGLQPLDLMAIDWQDDAQMVHPSITILPRPELALLLAKQDVLLNF